MGTGCIVRFWNGTDIVVAVYHHWGGYVSDVGQELAHFLCSRKMVNGLSSTAADGDIIEANGVGCLAAQWIAHVKTEPGNVYIDEGDMPVYAYDVHVTKDLKMTVRASYHGCTLLFNGTPDGFLEFANTSTDH